MSGAFFLSIKDHNFIGFRPREGIEVSFGGTYEHYNPWDG